MEIKFYGAGHGVPEAGRKCSCTLINVSGRYYMVDMGHDAINELITDGISPEEIRGIFITHDHGDHTNGLISYVDLINWYFKKADPLILFPDDKCIEGIKVWISCVERNTLREGIRMEVYPREGVIFDDGYLKVTAIPTKHFENSHGFLVEAEGKRVLFTGDLQKPCVDFPKVDGVVDLMICETAHFPSTEYLPEIADMDIRRVMVNHYGPVFYRYIPQFQDAMAERNVPVGVATDGLTVRI